MEKGEMGSVDRTGARTDGLAGLPAAPYSFAA